MNIVPTYVLWLQITADTSEGPKNLPIRLIPIVRQMVMSFFPQNILGLHNLSSKYPTQEHPIADSQNRQNEKQLQLGHFLSDRCQFLHSSNDSQKLTTFVLRTKKFEAKPNLCHHFLFLRKTKRHNITSGLTVPKGQYAQVVHIRVKGRAISQGQI